MHSLLLSLDHFDSYLRGKSSKYLKKYMEIYDDRLEIADRDFHQITFATASDEVKKRISSILKNLNISKEKRKEFHTGMTVYEILEQLAQQGHPQVKYILDLIDEKLKPSKWLLGLGGGILVSFLIYLLTLPTFQFVVIAIKSLLTSVTGIPIIGLVYNIILSLYYLYDTYMENRESRFNRSRDIFFLTLGAAGNISAYIILIATSAAASPIVAGLFVAAAGIDVVKEAFCLVQEYLQYVNNPPIDQNNQLTLQRAEARHVFGFEIRRNALGINLAAALLIAGITAVWCFLPPGGFIVTVAAFAAIGLVYLAKHVLLKWNEERLRDKLQKQLVEVETTYYNQSESIEDDLGIAVKFQSKSAPPYSPTRIPEPTPERQTALRNKPTTSLRQTSSAVVRRRLSFFDDEKDTKQNPHTASQSKTFPT